MIAPHHYTNVSRVADYLSQRLSKFCLSICLSAYVNAPHDSLPIIWERVRLERGISHLLSQRSDRSNCKQEDWRAARSSFETLRFTLPSPTCTSTGSLIADNSSFSAESSLEWLRLCLQSHPLMQGGLFQVATLTTATTIVTITAATTTAAITITVSALFGSSPCGVWPVSVRLDWYPIE